ncbi:MAG: Trk family potassium uptake protein [Clostridiales bacterium]|jgi:trk system potassium uptake protein|nr:Trk family potassium uptake protein [Clostridiales bacterium]
MNKFLRKLSVWQIIAIGYALVILLGSFLLSLPFSSKEHIWTPYLNSLFTATSATCVTGLVVYDTFTHWSGFGQAIILLMIQIGGIGFMSIITLFAMMLKKHIGLYERKIIAQSAGSNGRTGVVRLIQKVLIGTLIFEGAGTALLMIPFCRDMGFWKGLYYSVFHSISAFCNAGFDIMGFQGQFSSFTNYTGDPIVVLTLSTLIFWGGIGFIVWADISDNKFNWKKFQLHTRVALIASVLLIGISSLLFFLFEKDHIMKNMSAGEAFLASLFQAITPRTAGFNTIDTASLSESSSLLTMILMFIGGSSGSTAGGLKVTTFVVLLLGVFALSRNKGEISIGKRSIEQSQLLKAFTLFSLYLLTTVIFTLIIVAIEPFSLKSILFEVISAIGTVGLSTGITPLLSITSKLLIMLLIYIGRVGIITFVLAFSDTKNNSAIKKPTDRILIG